VILPFRYRRSLVEEVGIQAKEGYKLVLVEGKHQKRWNGLSWKVVAALVVVVGVQQWYLFSMLRAHSLLSGIPILQRWLVIVYSHALPKSEAASLMRKEASPTFFHNLLFDLRNEVRSNSFLCFMYWY
jgi:hypothetical protein